MDRKGLSKEILCELRPKLWENLAMQSWEIKQKGERQPGIENTFEEGKEGSVVGLKRVKRNRELEEEVR